MPRQSHLSIRGGTKTAAQFSGAVAPAVTASVTSVGSDVCLFSGPGRLISMVPHQNFLTLSGVALAVYDSAIPVSGGPIPASGHVPLAVYPAAYGASGQLSTAGQLVEFFTPFANGLCFNSRSGQPGVTFTWLPETGN